MADYDRDRLLSAGLLPTRGCPAPGHIAIWTNTDQRTIDSGQALAERVVPGCHIAIGHLPVGSEDPLFHPVEAGVVHLDGSLAAASIQAETGGPEKVLQPLRPALDHFASIMGCRPQDNNPDCAIAEQPSQLLGAQKGQKLDLAGPIMTTSGTAEVLLMQYVEGWPLSQVGWGRADRVGLVQLSQLHAALFAIFARPALMARSTMAVMAPHIVQLLRSSTAPAINIFVGSDNNISALSALLGTNFELGGYALNDPPIGGALRIDLWRDRKTGQQSVTLTYQAQSLDQLRQLAPLTLETPPQLQALTPACASISSEGRCSLSSFVRLLEPQ